MPYDSPGSATASAAMIGYGSHFHLRAEDSPLGAWVHLGEVFNITPPSSTTDLIDVTHMQSPGGRREFVAGLIDPGECSFEMNYIPNSTGDLILLAILDLDPADRARDCRIIYPNGVSHNFTGILQTYEATIPTDDKMTATVTFKVTGAMTRGVDSPEA